MFRLHRWFLVFVALALPTVPTGWGQPIVATTKPTSAGTTTKTEPPLREAAASHQQAPVVDGPFEAPVKAPIKAPVRDCADCPWMVRLPLGTFRLGSPASENKRRPDEGPVPYAVEMDYELFMGQYEVTVQEFKIFVDQTGHKTDGTCWGYRKGGWENGPYWTWANPGFPQTDASPVVCVNWYDANAYLNWLSAETGRAYRLPTEAEWEYAARGGTTTAFWWGKTVSSTNANYGKESIESLGLSRGLPSARTTRVGTYPHNPFGLYDTHGNVSEWVADCYHWFAYKQHTIYPRMYGSRQDSCRRIQRGGAWNSRRAWWLLRVGLRSQANAEDRFNFVGFRAARTEKPSD